jgi:translation initiation factor eIF-2B subunit beta
VNETEVLDLIKPLVIEEICDLVDEIKALSHSICDQAENHIYAEEVIMTFGLSKTVVAFLQAAAEFRRFYVFVAQSAPGYQGNQQAVNLAKAGIDVTVVPDSSVFAIMSHVSKVIIGTHAVLANGGLLAYSGAHNILLAAKHHAVPTLVLTGLYKLSPLYAFDGDTFNLHNPPSQMLDFENLTADQEPEVINPAFDYVPPELITLFITNNQGHSPFYIYRLLSEYYHPDDYDID